MYSKAICLLGVLFLVSSIQAETTTTTLSINNEASEDIVTIYPTNVDDEDFVPSGNPVKVLQGMRINHDLTKSVKLELIDNRKGTFHVVMVFADGKSSEFKITQAAAIDENYVNEFEVINAEGKSIVCYHGDTNELVVLVNDQV